jgi:hypothetical protein
MDQNKMMEPRQKRTGIANKGIQKVAKDARRLKAELMQAEYVKLSVTEKISKLDAKLGVGIGAQKQRARLNAKEEK